MKKLILLFLLTVSLVCSISFVSAGSINSIYWSSNQIDSITQSYHGKLVYACIQTTGLDSQQASFEVRESDGGDGDLIESLSPVTISNGKACASWAVKWTYDHGAFTNSGDEYILKAKVGTLERINTGTAYELIVPEPSIDSAYWSTRSDGSDTITSAKDGDLVYMCINTKNYARDSAQIDLYESDYSLLADDYITTRYVTLDNFAKACTSWTARWIDDSDDLGGGDEYKFTAKYILDETTLDRTSSTLDVPAPYTMKDTKMSCSDIEINKGLSVTLTAKLEEADFWLTDLPNKNVKFYIDYNYITQDSTDSNGIAEYTYTPANTVKTYLVNASFNELLEGNVKYNPSSCKFYLKVKDPSKKEASITISDKTAIVNEQVRLEAKLTGPSSGKLISFSVDNILLGNGVTDSSGIAFLPYTPREAKEYSIYVYFAGDSEYNSAQRTVRLTVQQERVCAAESDNPHIINKCTNDKGVISQENCLSERTYNNYQCNTAKNCEAVEKTCPENELCSWGVCIAKCPVNGERKCNADKTKSMICENGRWKIATCTNGCASNGVCSAETSLGNVYDTDINNPSGEFSQSVCVDSTGAYYDECGCLDAGTFYPIGNEKCLGKETSYLRSYSKGTNKCAESAELCTTRVCGDGRCVPSEELLVESDMQDPSVNLIITPSPSVISAADMAIFESHATDDTGITKITNYLTFLDNNGITISESCFFTPSSESASCSSFEGWLSIGRYEFKSEVVDRAGKVTKKTQIVSVGEMVASTLRDKFYSIGGILHVPITYDPIYDEVKGDIICCTRTSIEGKVDCGWAKLTRTPVDNPGSTTVCNAVNKCFSQKANIKSIIGADIVAIVVVNPINPPGKNILSEDKAIWLPGEPQGAARECINKENPKYPSVIFGTPYVYQEHNFAQGTISTYRDRYVLPIYYKNMFLSWVANKLKIYMWRTPPGNTPGNCFDGSGNWNIDPGIFHEATGTSLYDEYNEPLRKGDVTLIPVVFLPTQGTTYRFCVGIDENKDGKVTSSEQMISASKDIPL